MSSAYQNYVEAQLSDERRLVFNEDELKVVHDLQDRLSAKGKAHCWDELTHEEKLCLVRGYWERPHKARDMSVAAIDTYAWRKQNKMDNILDTRMPLHDEYHECWPSYVSGEDKYGHFIVMDRVSELEVGALAKYDQDTVLRYRAQCLEAFAKLKLETSHRLGSRVCRYIYVLDLKGLSLKKHFTSKVRALLQPLFAMSGDCYPDSLWSLYLLNAPFAFRAILQVINPWIDPVVKTKIRMLSGPKQYLPAMVKAGIPMESIPEAIGGSASSVLLRDLVEEMIDTPEIKDHGFTANPAPGDPVAQEAQKKELATIAKRPSILGTIAKVRNVKTFRRKTTTLSPVDSSASAGAGDSVGDTDAEQVQDIAEDGELVYNAEDVLMKGYMSKQGSFNSAWRRRYFVLTPGGLFYFASEPTKDSHVPKGRIELHMINSAKPHTPARSAADEALAVSGSAVRRSDNDDNDDAEEETDGISALDAVDTGSGNANDGLLDVVTPRRLYQMRVEPEDVPADEFMGSTGTGEEEASVGALARLWIESIRSAAENDIGLLDIEALHKASENHIHAGFLGKRGAFNRSWRRRYFVLTSHALYYYNDIPTNVGAALKGRIDLFRVTATDFSSSKHTEFSITQKGRVFHLRAEFEAEAEKWLNIISTAVEEEAQARDRAANDSDSDYDLSSPAKPPMLRPENLDDETRATLGRTSSTVVAQITGLAGEFLSIAAEMGILRKDEELPSQESMLEDVRKRVLHMFKIF